MLTSFSLHMIFHFSYFALCLRIGLLLAILGIHYSSGFWRKMVNWNAKNESFVLFSMLEYCVVNSSILGILLLCWISA